jgi:hypothetical protein
MIITYDIGSVGLNLHEACDFVILQLQDGVGARRPRHLGVAYKYVL